MIRSYLRSLLRAERSHWERDASLDEASDALSPLTKALGVLVFGLGTCAAGLLYYFGLI